MVTCCIGFFANRHIKRIVPVDESHRASVCIGHEAAKHPSVVQTIIGEILPIIVVQ